MLESHIPTMEKSSDVKTMLFFVAIAGGILWLLGFLHFVLTAPHRDYLLGLLSRASLEIGAGFSLSFLAIAIAFVAIVIFEVHETIYDDHFVKWRARHNSEFILPRLFGVFRDQLAPDYSAALKANAETLRDRVFCPFVEGKEHIESKLIRRFYKALTWYWISELVEMSIIGWLLCTFAYAAWGRLADTVPVEWQAALLFQLPVVLALGAINNLIVVRMARKAVRNRTLAEIEEILYSHREKLREMVLRAAKELGFLHVSPVQAARISESKRDEVFLASPMASFPDAGEYPAERELMLALVGCLKDHCKFTEVHYAGNALASGGEFHDHYRALTDDLRLIERSSVFIFHYPKPLPTSALFALGYALALGKQILILVKRHDDLPFLLKAALQLETVKEYTYRDQSDLIGLIVALHPAIFQPKRAGSQAAPAVAH